MRAAAELEEAFARCTSEAAAARPALKKSREPSPPNTLSQAIEKSVYYLLQWMWIGNVDGVRCKPCRPAALPPCRPNTPFCAMLTGLDHVVFAVRDYKHTIEYSIRFSLYTTIRFSMIPPGLV